MPSQLAAMPKVCTDRRNTESLLRRPENEEARSREYLQRLGTSSQRNITK